ncbi:MAG: DUF4129 domain-containing protein [Gaiellaceae bacterium]
MTRRRLVPLALAVTLLLAVVALAAGGRPLGSGGGSRGGLPWSFWDYTYTTIVIVFVPLLLAGVLVGALLRRREGHRRTFWQSLLRSLVIFALLLGLELLVVRYLKLAHIHLHLHRLQQTGPVKPGQSRGHHPHSGTRSLHFRWDELAIVLGLLVVAAAIVAVRRPRPQPRAPRTIAPEALAAALDESLDDLRADPDLRRAIIAAYARMETALAAAGIPRHPSEAPLEYLERALLSLDASAEAVRRLTDLFEWARFSHHEPEPSMRDDAVDALIAVRDELRVPDRELTPS